MAFWIYVVPPLAGLVIGYFTNDIAIKMLFRPYRPYRVFGWRIPFTPRFDPAEPTPSGQADRQDHHGIPAHAGGTAQSGP